MRGNFWPGACLATIKDLQQALISNIANDHSDQQENASPRTQLHELQRYSIYNADIHTRQSLGVALNGTLPIKPPLSSIPQLRNNIRPINLSKDSQFNQATPSTIISAPLGTPSSSIQTQAAQLSSFQSNGPAHSDISSGGVNNNSFYTMENQFSGSIDNELVRFDDIFQLMDASYNLSEHMYSAPDIGTSA